MKPGKKLFLVEDDIELAHMIKDFLEAEGFRVHWVDNGLTAVEYLQSNEPDLVILDILLPEINGIEVCRRISPTFKGPVLMLTARDNEFSEIAALRNGAVGYLTKPVRPHILLAHINALLRGAGRFSKPDDDTYLTIQDLVVDIKSHRVMRGDETLDLTTSEIELLYFLARQAGRMVTRDELYQHLRGIEYDGLDRAMDMRISSLRKKMGDANPPYQYIKTVRGTGYILSVR